MSCQQKPTEFDKAQLEKCKGCKWVSKAVRFCSCPKWGGIDIGYPSNIQMAKNLGKAAFDHARAGFPKRSPERIAEIMRICKQCPSYVKDAERCRKCGCRTPAKIKWGEQVCPAKKW